MLSVERKRESIRVRCTKRLKAEASEADGQPPIAASSPTPAWRPAAAVAISSHIIERVRQVISTVVSAKEKPGMAADAKSVGG